MLKVHQAIARALSDNGVETLFGLMGDANMFMVDSFVRDIACVCSFSKCLNGLIGNDDVVFFIINARSWRSRSNGAA